MKTVSQVFESKLPPRERLIALVIANGADYETDDDMKRLESITGHATISIKRGIERLYKVGWLK